MHNGLEIPPRPPWSPVPPLPPPSGVMNPKPLASLNHFTVPVLRMRYSQTFAVSRGTKVCPPRMGISEMASPGRASAPA